MSATTDWQRRLAARSRSRRRTRLAVTSGVAGTLLVLGALGWVLLGTSLLGVQEVRVAGVSRLAAAEVRAAAAITAGTPMATLDASAVAGRVADLRVVRRVSVERQWPRTVTISVTERVAAAVQARGPAYALVDRDGVVFAEQSQRPRGLPLVSAPVDAGAAALRAAVAVLDQLPQGVRGDVRQVRAASRDQVEVRLTRGRTVVWGSTERGPRKAAVLAVLVTRRASVYDVSAPDTPTTTK